MNIYIHNFTGVYELQRFYKEFPFVVFDDRGISGVRGYMDEEAKKFLSSEIRKKGEISSVHFLDSGNYHHVSRLYLNFIKEPFNLIVYDNHTDMQSSAFGSILSCGSWIADAFNGSDKLKNIVLVGVNEKYIDECEYKNDKRIFFVKSSVEAKDALSDKLPVYLSVDKDVLSAAEFISDWDQGEMSLDKLISELKYIKSNYNVLGVDVCGEPGTSDFSAIAKSDGINMVIVKTLLNE